MKKIISVSVVLGLFMWLNMATKRVEFFPCESNIMRYTDKDTLTRSYYIGATHDTVMLVVFKDTLLEKLSTDICGILKDSCKMQGFKIQIRDTTSDPSRWNTPSCKQLYFKVCP